MARKERYPGKSSEYGGGDGSPQRFKDGSSLDLSASSASESASERARLLRTAMAEDYDPGRSDLVGLAAGEIDPAVMSAAQTEAYERDLERSRKLKAQRERLNDKTNGYIDEPDQYMGEEVN